MNNKVVYLLKDSEGIVRYVGSGTLIRANSTQPRSGRGKAYAEFVKANGKPEVEIIADRLSTTEAEDLEREMYDKYSDVILNARRPNSFNIMTKEMFENDLYYDETSASGLRWKIDKIGGCGAVKIKAGSEAGSMGKLDGYYSVGLRGKLYRAHRIIAVLHGLDISGKVIDHIDRDRSNNKIENLRVVSQKENMQNRGKQNLNSNNKSGIQGVCCERQRYWTATWYENGKHKSKRFPIKNFVSSEEAFIAAVEYRQQMVELHHN